MNSGTIGEGGVASTVIDGIEGIIKMTAESRKHAALQYFSKKVTPNNFAALSGVFNQNDANNSGFLSNDDFRRCLSSSQMKVTDNEVQQLIQELDKEQ